MTGASSPAAPEAKSPKEAASPKTAAELEAEYTALKDKQTPSAVALREERNAARAREMDKPTTITSGVNLPPKIDKVKNPPPWWLGERHYRLGLRSVKMDDGYAQMPPRDPGLTFGGQAFMRVSADENPNVTDGTARFENEVRGQRVYLTEWDLANLLSHFGKKFVRVRNRETNNCVILRYGSAAGRKQLKGDIPLEEFLTIKPARTPEDAASARTMADDEYGLT